MTLAPGTRLGPYEIVGPLGAGGMGEVYRAKDTRLGREVAVKVLPAHLSANSEVRARFEREARAVSALNHPHVCVLHDVGREGETDYLVMELVEGETLAQRLARGALPTAEVLRLGAQVAAALDRAHRAGVVHRDLKPGNVMVTRAGAKLMDFGLARATNPAGTPSELTSGPTVVTPARSEAPLTAEGSLVGTFQYMAPEQVEGRDVDARADVWALGCLLYEMAAGVRAFAGDSTARLIAAILKDEPRALADVQPVTPAALDWLVRRCLAKDPDDRWQSAHDVALQLGWIAGGGAGPAAAAEPVAPEGRFQKLTFRRGNVGAARFLPDGQTIVYSAAWGGAAERVYIRRLDSNDSAEVALPPASLLAVSRQGELALSVDRVWRTSWTESEGTLCRAPLFGGTPRALAERVHLADWAADGGSLAVITRREDDVCLEWPPGRVLVSSPYWKGSPRVSPDGALVAYSELFGPRGNSIQVADREGRVRTFAEFDLWPSGLAWTPDGRELVFAQFGGTHGSEIAAVGLDGRRRTLLRLPGTVDVQDVSASGDVLLLQGERAVEASLFVAGESRERHVGSFDVSMVKDISEDGRFVLFDEVGAAVNGQPQVYLRAVDGAPPVLLGPGFARAISPDGRWVLATRPGQLAIMPTGSGQGYEVESRRARLASNACWFPDGRRLLVTGNEPDRPARFFEVSLPEGEWRPVTPEGATLAWGAGARALDSSGTRVFARSAPDTLEVWNLATGEREANGPLAPQFAPIRWHADGRRVFVTDRGRYPVTLRLFDPASGELGEPREYALHDPTGVYANRFVVASADGSLVAASTARDLLQLYRVRGLL